MAESRNYSRLRLKWNDYVLAAQGASRKSWLRQRRKWKRAICSSGNERTAASAPSAWSLLPRIKWETLSAVPNFTAASIHQHAQWS